MPSDTSTADLEDPASCMSEMMGLMKKIETMKAMLQSVGEAAAKGGAKDDYTMAGDEKGINDSDLPPMQDEEDESEDEEDVKEMIDADLMNDPKIAGYMEDLDALEREKANMVQQLADAQQQQADMVERLDEMKKMMALFKAGPTTVM